MIIGLKLITPIKKIDGKNFLFGKKEQYFFLVGKHVFFLLFFIEKVFFVEKHLKKNYLGDNKLHEIKKRIKRKDTARNNK